MIAFLQIVLRLLADVVGLLAFPFRLRRSLEAENLFLRRQLALDKERGGKPHWVDAAARVSLAFISKLCDWRFCLIVVRPETLILWHRAGWSLFWRYKSTPGRPPIAPELRQLIRRMAMENRLWGEERIANELLLRLGVRVSPRTVRKYMPKRPVGCPRGDQRWLTLLRNHAQAVIACDFFVAVTATFRLLYVFVVIHHSSRRLLHFHVTEHPTSAWTLQQLPEAVGHEACYRYLIHDRDSIFPKSLDESIARLGMMILKSPFQSPTANAICERVIGTIRRECLHWMIPFAGAHLRLILKSWVRHYNRGRPHMSLGPGVPIHRECRGGSKTRSSGIVSARALWYTLSRCWAGCITNTHSWRRSPDSAFADDSYFVSTVGGDEAVIREDIRPQEEEDTRLEQMKLWR